MQLNNPSNLANNNSTLYPSGIGGRILPSGYAHFADSLQEHVNNSSQSSYITNFPSGWDENVAAKERYSNLDSLKTSSEVFFPIYTSGINLKGAQSLYTAAPPAGGLSTMSKLFACE
jgi:hypothetical protein